jgi:hypothetical protein
MTEITSKAFLQKDILPIKQDAKFMVGDEEEEP